MEIHFEKQTLYLYKKLYYFVLYTICGYKPNGHSRPGSVTVWVTDSKQQAQSPGFCCWVRAIIIALDIVHYSINWMYAYTALVL